MTVPGQSFRETPTWSFIVWLLYTKSSKLAWASHLIVFSLILGFYFPGHVWSLCALHLSSTLKVHSVGATHGLAKHHWLDWVNCEMSLILQQSFSLSLWFGNFLTLIRLFFLTPSDSVFPSVCISLFPDWFICINSVVSSLPSFMQKFTFTVVMTCYLKYESYSVIPQLEKWIIAFMDYSCPGFGMKLAS